MPCVSRHSRAIHCFRRTLLIEQWRFHEARIVHRRHFVSRLSVVGPVMSKRYVVTLRNQTEGVIEMISTVGRRICFPVDELDGAFESSIAATHPFLFGYAE